MGECSLWWPFFSFVLVPFSRLEGEEEGGKVVTGSWCWCTLSARPFPLSSSSGYGCWCCCTLPGNSASTPNGPHTHTPKHSHLASEVFMCQFSFRQIASRLEASTPQPQQQQSCRHFLEFSNSVCLGVFFFSCSIFSSLLPLLLLLLLGVLGARPLMK